MMRFNLQLILGIKLSSDVSFKAVSKFGIFDEQLYKIEINLTNNPLIHESKGDLWLANTFALNQSTAAVVLIKIETSSNIQK